VHREIAAAAAAAAAVQQLQHPLAVAAAAAKVVASCLLLAAEAAVAAALAEVMPSLQDRHLCVGCKATGRQLLCNAAPQGGWQALLPGPLAVPEHP
jgi:hypothetical protein